MEGTPLISYTARRYVELAVAVFGVVWLLSALVAAATLFNVRADFSPGARFTLSDHARRVLETVDEPLRVTAFIRTEDPRNPIIKDLLWQVSRENPHISYDVVDINRNPAMATRYGVDAYGSTVVESATKRADFGNPNERQLTAAILRVLQKPKKIYFTVGHGECSTKNTDRRVGCSLVRDALSLESYDVETLPLSATGAVPDDADVVVVLGPKTDLLPAALDALDAFVDTGGKLLVAIDPYRAPALTSRLGVRGIEVGTNVVLDPDNRLSGGEPTSAVITDLNRSHLVSRTLDAPPLFSGAVSVRARSDDAADIQAIELLKTGPRSWASFDPEAERDTRPRFVAGRDLNGPLVVGIEWSAPAVRPLDGRARTRMLVFGDADFATNRFLDYLGNKDLLVNAVNWLAREERLIATRPSNKTPGVNQFFISQQDGESIFWYAVVWQPGLFFAAALVALVRRRLAP